MTELLPCPFCGGKAELHALHDIRTDEVDGWFVWCSKDNACAIQPMTGDYNTEAEAIAAWNTCAERTCKPLDYSDEWYTHKALSRDEWYMPSAACSACGEYIPVWNYCPNCGAKVVG